MTAITTEGDEVGVARVLITDQPGWHEAIVNQDFGLSVLWDGKGKGCAGIGVMRSGEGTHISEARCGAPKFVVVL